MKPILIIYGTTDGQTAKIARFVGDTIRSTGRRVNVVDAATGVNPPPEEYGLVIVAASVHAGGYQRSVRRWVRNHVTALNAMPTVFLSVCLGVLEHNRDVDEDLGRIMRNFFDRTGWHPTTREIVAGALRYTEYNFLKRWVIVRIVSKVPGGDIDTSRNFEYTDWDALRAFALRCSGTSVPAAA